MIVLDELNKVSTKDIFNYLLHYFNNDELNNISFIARYKSQDCWHCKLEYSNRTIYSKTLKDLVVELLSNDSYLDEIITGRYYEKIRRK
jgi:hypothetical protein